MANPKNKKTPEPERFEQGFFSNDRLHFTPDTETDADVEAVRRLIEPPDDQLKSDCFFLITLANLFLSSPSDNTCF